MEKKWFVIYTRPRQELKVVEKLNALGITNYCPTVNLIKQYSDRKKKETTSSMRRMPVSTIGRSHTLQNARHMQAIGQTIANNPSKLLCKKCFSLSSSFFLLSSHIMCFEKEFRFF